MLPNTNIAQALTAAARALGRDRSWVVGGSAGLALRGIRLSQPPNDVDLYADDDDFGLLYERLSRETRVSEPELSVTAMYRSMLGCCIIHEVEVELVGGFSVTAHGCVYKTEVHDLLYPHALEVKLADDVVVPVVPLAHELWFNALRGRMDRVQAIVEAIGDDAAERAVMKAIERRNGFAEQTVAVVRSWLEKREAGGWLEL
ncbi:hypothetical protein [Paenibacillus protaetiae]|uniref:Nucleotidyltransferase family protein n=1 Tax=Paenibacillus protaetiae TaxID=2509456 RepID=A0A4P6EUL4_9BACL|nr:hypothetical protein [Paenibacillus protaetiae]QAY66175.1 hypothetical protein ET464_06960 [Paenibacillus protaetiae]